MWFALLPPAAAEAPPPLPPDARFALALFCSPTCSDEVADTLDQGLASIPARNGFPDRATRAARVMGMAGTDFGIPDATFVELYGVGVDRPDELAKSEEVLLAWFAAPREQAAATLATAHAAFAAAAKKGGGWVEDLDAQRLYGADAWARLDPKGPLTDWFVVDAESMDENNPDGPLRLVTRGLRRFGDYELVVEDVPETTVGDVSTVLNALAEAMHGRADSPAALKIETATVKGKASFRAARRRDTDPEEPLLRATFDGEITLPAQPRGPVAVAAAQPKARPGVATDASSELDADAAPAGEGAQDAASLALPAGASATPQAAPVAPATFEEAQNAALDRFDHVVRPAFLAGLPSGEAVAVKVPFRTRSGGNEYMWVELRSVRGEDITGVLMNDPWEVDGLRKGDTVVVRATDVFDYVWKKADGSREGNTTAAFLK